MTFEEFCAAFGVVNFSEHFRGNLTELLKKHGFSNSVRAEDLSFANFIYENGQVVDFEITSHAQSALFMRPEQIREIKSLVLLISNFDFSEGSKEIFFNVSACTSTRKNPAAYQLLAQYTYSTTGQLVREKSLMATAQRTVPEITIT